MSGENAKENVNESSSIYSVESISDEEALECSFPGTNGTIDEAIRQRNNELLELDPNEYMIGLLNDLNNPGEELDENDKKIAENIIKETFGEKFSMKDLFEMDLKKKTELLWKLTAIKKFIPTKSTDIMYTSITEQLRQGCKIGELYLKLKSGTLKKPNNEDIKKYFNKAQAFQIQNMLKLYRKTFPFGSKNIPTMRYAPLTGNINGNDSISKDFSNVGREYYNYNLSDLDNDR